MTLSNPTAESFAIDGAFAGCSCSEPILDTKRLAPGESTRLRVTWRTQLRDGPVELPISVRYVAIGAGPSEPRECRIVLKGNVEPDLVIEPKVPTFDRAVSVVVVQIVPGRKAVPKFVRALSNVDGISATIDGSIITLRRTGKTNFDLDGQILVETDDESRKWWSFPFRIGRPTGHHQGEGVR